MVGVGGGAAYGVVGGILQIVFDVGLGILLANVIEGPISDCLVQVGLQRTLYPPVGPAGPDAEKDVLNEIAGVTCGVDVLRREAAQLRVVGTKQLFERSLVSVPYLLNPVPLALRHRQEGFRPGKKRFRTPVFRIRFGSTEGDFP